MAYTFAPRGLQATSSISNATPSGQIDNYLIPSGYAANIASGDLVAVVPDTGTIRSLSGVANYIAADPGTVLGVFVGCSFEIGYGASQVFPASTAMTPIPTTGTPYWPGGTVTKDGMPALAQVIVDPNTVFNIQVSGNVNGVNTPRGVPVPVVAPTGVAQVAGTFVPFNTLGGRFDCAQGGVVGSTFQGLSVMSAVSLSVANGNALGTNLYMLRYSPNTELNTGEWVMTNGVLRPTDPYPVIEVKLNLSTYQLHALRDTNEDLRKEVAEIRNALDLMLKDRLKKEGK